MFRLCESLFPKYKQDKCYIFYWSSTNNRMRQTQRFVTAHATVQNLFNLSRHLVEVCSRCGGYGRVIACIGDQDIIDRILAHLRETEKEAPALPLLIPPTRAPPATLSLFAGTEFNQQGRHWKPHGTDCCGLSFRNGRIWIARSPQRTTFQGSRRVCREFL